MVKFKSALSSTLSKGLQHNFQTLSAIFDDLQAQSITELDWKVYWAKTFLFDTLIGNTDRHQDNWCVIEVSSVYDQAKNLRLCPVFDNGTSMGHEIAATNFKKYDDIKILDHYVSRGWHHMKWQLILEKCLRAKKSASS